VKGVFGEGGGLRTMHSSVSKYGPVQGSRITMINLLRQIEQYALVTEKHLN